MHEEDVSAAIARDQESIERYTQLFREKEERLRREREAEEAARGLAAAGWGRQGGHE